MTALKDILEVCHTETWSHATKVRRIIVIADNSILGLGSKHSPDNRRR